jgi:hypothetical protein
MVSNTPDDKIASKFHEAFAEPLSSSRREAMQVLFPMCGNRWARTMSKLE